MCSSDLINLDFADVRSVMGEMGKAMMGTGEASGENRAIEAAEKAIANPLLDGVSMKGAKGVIISITGGEDMRLMEVDEAASHIKELVDPDANIIWGSAFNNDLEGKIRVSVVATGIEADAAVAPEPARVFAFPSTRKSEEIIRTPEPVIAPVPFAAPDAVTELEIAESVEEDAVAEAEMPEPVAQSEEAPLTLEPPMPAEAVASFSDEGDELLLGPQSVLDEAIGTNPVPAKFYG